MINRKFPAIALVLIALQVAVSGQSASELIATHTRKAAEAIEAYLKKNPEAKDSTEAIDFLIESYSRLGMGERKAQLL